MRLRQSSEAETSSVTLSSRCCEAQTSSVTHTEGPSKHYGWHWAPLAPTPQLHTSLTPSRALLADDLEIRPRGIVPFYGCM
jgi:hypothetical protein